MTNKIRNKEIATVSYILMCNIYIEPITTCSAQTQTRMGCLRKSPEVEFDSYHWLSHLGKRAPYVARRKRRYEANQVWMNTTFISQGPQSWGKLAAPKLLLFGLGRISNFWLLLSLAEELSFRWCCLSFMWSSSDLSTQATQLIWAASLSYCTGCCTGKTCQNIFVLSKYLQAHIFSPFPGEKSKTCLGL